jgi:hypothetical protein
MRTAVLLSSLAIAGMASAQVFQSGFEDWTNNLPDGWMGTKSNIVATSVTQVTDNVHGGASAVRLENTTSSHKRFTTQPLTVTNGQNYSVSFWVRGAGEVRVGLYDGRPGGSSGYATYTPYNTATADWQQVTVTIAAAYDTTGGEFILSVRNTVAPEHVVIDDVTIGDAAPLTPTSIYDIQYTTDPSGDSPYNLQSVLTGGVVSAVMTGDGYFVQSGSGPWSGIYVYDQDNTPSIGDSITFTANVSEYYDLTELSGVSGYTVVSSGNTVSAFDVATGDVSLEPMESVLVRVSNATCTVAPSGATFGKYNVDDGSGEAIIGKEIYTTDPDPVVGNVYTITGVNYYTFGEFNIEPRDANDVDFTSGVAEAGLLDGVAFGPNPARDLLTVNLGQAAGSNVNFVLVDMQGRTVQSGQLTVATNRINVADMPVGMYHLTLRTAEGAKTFAVQVAR